MLAQSPQFYKQMMVGVFDRVFETGPVFRAEKHNTRRHLNEYTSLDFEMGYIEDFMDIMADGDRISPVHDGASEKRLRTRSLRSAECHPSESRYRSPLYGSSEAKELVAEKYNRKIRNPYDLEPEEEALIGRYFKEEYGSRFRVCHPLSLQEAPVLRHG